MAGMGTGLGMTGATGAAGGMPEGEMPTGEPPAGMSGGMGGGMGMGAQQDTTTYQTVEEYFAKLNENETWAIYDAATNTARVDNLRGFIDS